MNLQVENDEDTFDNWLIVDQDEGGTIAVLPKGPTDELKERQWRRACEMAAALDLLKALERLKVRFTQVVNEADCCWLDWPGAYQVDAAIAKARGDWKSMSKAQGKAVDNG